MAEEKGKKMIGSYDIKVPEDTDVTLGYDVTANKVKNFKFSGIWTWLISKLKGSSISDLNTRNKTVVGAIKEVNTPTFTTATSRTNINSGESQSIIMGKIKKWLADLGTAAFCSVVNNLTTTAEGSVLDARQGKNLSDALTKLNTLMGSTDISAIGGGTLTGAISELNSKALKPLYSGYISNTPLTIKLSIGLYFITTYRNGGYKISSLSVLNIQIDNGSFLETLVKGEDYDNTVKMDCTENGLSANYKIKLSGDCAIKIYKVCQ